MRGISTALQHARESAAARVGVRFGLLTVIGPAPVAPDGAARVQTRCGCGCIAVRRITDLEEGRALACVRCRPQERTLRVKAKGHTHQVPRPPRPTEDGEQWLRELAENPVQRRRVLKQLEELVVKYLEKRWRSVERRELEQLEARAALYRRFCFLGADAIAAKLARPDVSRPVLHQWVYRGRKVLLAALAQWASEPRRTAARERRIALVRGVLEAGRTDAGTSRAQRGAHPNVDRWRSVSPTVVDSHAGVLDERVDLSSQPVVERVR